jgi:hypothetical protein
VSPQSYLTVHQISQGYCITCSQSVCPVCIANEHQKHDFQEMEKLYSEKYTTIKEINDSIENETLVRFDEQLNKIEVTRESDNRHLHTGQTD